MCLIFYLNLIEDFLANNHKSPATTIPTCSSVSTTLPWSDVKMELNENGTFAGENENENFVDTNAGSLEIPSGEEIQKADVECNTDFPIVEMKTSQTSADNHFNTKSSVGINTERQKFVESEIQAGPSCSQRNEIGSQTDHGAGIVPQTAACSKCNTVESAKSSPWTPPKTGIRPMRPPAPPSPMTKYFGTATGIQQLSVAFPPPNISTIPSTAPTTPIPPTPMSSLMEPSKNLRSLIRIEQDPNGDATMVMTDLKQLPQISETEFEEFAAMFLKETLAEDSAGVPKHVIGVIRNGASYMPDIAEYFAKNHGDLVVKIGSLTSRQDIESTTMGKYYQDIETTYSAGTYRAGPLMSSK